MPYFDISHRKIVVFPNKTATFVPSKSPFPTIPTVMLNLAHYFPITDPTWIFFVVLAIILSAPLLFDRLRIPHLVGMIIAGILVGEHGLDILSRDSSFELFGNVGLYYIMFLASLGLDMEGLRKNRRRGILFGVLTFLIPFAIGYAVSLWVLHFGMLASLLLSCILASHTLIAYPIVGRYGLSRHDCVTIAVCGTVIALLASLVVLAVISASARGTLDWHFWLWLMAKTAVYAFILFFCYPRLTRFFFKRWNDNITQFIFVLALMLLSAAMSDFIGLEGLLGAFLAGLVLNRYIPHVSPLMNRIEFVGNALFIPYFLIGVGMLIDVRTLFTHPSGWLVVIVIVSTAMASKWFAALVAQKVMRLTSTDRRLLFGLSNAHAAGALAMVMVGTALEVAPGVSLMSDDVLNGVVMLILVTCIVSSLVTDRASRTTRENEAAHPTTPYDASEKMLIPLSNPSTVEQLISTAILLRGGRSEKALVAMQVSIEGQHMETQKEQGKRNLEVAARTAAAANVPLLTHNRMGTNVAGSILHAMEETDATELIVGLHHRRGITDTFLGTTVTALVEGTNRQIVIMKSLMPVNVVHRIIVAIPAKAELEAGFYRWLERLCRMGEQLGCRADFHCHPSTEPFIHTFIRSYHPTMRYSTFELSDWADLLMVTDGLSFDHLFVLVTARRGTVSWQPSFDNLPTQLMRYFANNSLMIIYPQQYELDTTNRTALRVR